jgi:hypothetical protein
MTIDVAAMVAIVVSPRRGFVDAVTRFRGVHLVLVDVTSVSVHRRPVERSVGTGTGTVIGTGHVLVLVIMTAEEMIRGRGTGIADADTNDHVMGHLLSLLRLCDMLLLRFPCTV